jgi:mannose-6-phosphate isomerase
LGSVARRAMPDNVPRMRRVEKPWGHELIWAQTDRYVGKVLHVNAGQRLSLQYHEKKDETIHLWSGRLILVVDEGKGLHERELKPGESYHVRPGVKHRMIAITDCDVLEASTPELDDVVRLEDAYGRVK